MSEYYVGAFCFNDHSAISHSRPKGSRNGFTTMANYIPIGKKAKGRYDPSLGRYVYSTGVEKARSKAKAMTGYAANRAKSGYSNVKKAVGNAYSRTKANVQGHYNPMTGRYESNYGGAARSKVNALTGYAANRAKSGYSSAKTAVGNAYGSASRYASSAYSNAKRAAGDAYRQGREFLTGSNSRLGMERARDERSAERARQQYERTLPGRIERFGRNVSNFATTSYSKVKNWISTAGRKAGAAISSAKRTLRKYGSMAISSITTAASSTAGKVKSFLTNLFKKKKNTRSHKKMSGYTE